MQENVPLIPIPRLVLTAKRPDIRSNIHASELIDESRKTYRPLSEEDEDNLHEIERLTCLSILDLPPQLIASSIVDLWRDLESDKSREDFLRYQRGWIGHAVLLGCLNSTGTEVIERV